MGCRRRENRRLQAKNDPLAPSGYGEARRGVGPLLGLISRGEGTDRPDGYDVVYGYDRFKPPGTGRLTDMTIKEVRALQDEMVRRGAPTGAAGKYQVVGATMNYLTKRMGLDGSERFTPLLQDQMARELLARHGYEAFVSGKLKPGDFQKNLSGEWASVPPVGKDFRITSAEVQDALSKTLAAEKALQDDIEAGREPW
jgi:muramidase (phage lysozyme)